MVLHQLRFWTGLVLTAVVLCLPIGLLNSDRPMLGQEVSRSSKSVKSKLTPAKNPTQLIVLVEPGKLLGWISGTTDRVGAVAKIRVSGKPLEEVKVEIGNTFAWQYSTPKEMPADIQVGDLRQTVTLLPAAKTGPSVFFVLDRLVFRPGQTMHFAGFLRELDANGEFRPIAKKAVEVTLCSEKKKSVAKKWTLTADEAGRITADYPFTDADPIDAYTLNIDGWKRGARVVLAEYRKLTSSLAINGQLDGSKLRVQFEAVDYTGQTTSAEKIHITTRIVPLTAPKETGEFNPAEFVHATPLAPNQPRPDSLSDDEQLVAPFQTGPLSFGTMPFAVLQENKTDLKLDGKGKGEIEIVVPGNWRQNRYSAIVEAVLTDSAGRELRAVQQIPLDGTDNGIQLRLSKSVVSVDEPFEVKALAKEPADRKGKGTLVVLKLNPITPLTAPAPIGFSGLTPMSFSGAPGFIGASGAPAGFMGPPGGMSPMGFGVSGSPPSGGFSSTGFPGYPFGSCYGIGCPYSYPFVPPTPPIPSTPFRRGIPTRTPAVQPSPKATELGYSPTIGREFTTATVFQGDTAMLRLSDPGAYKLVVIWNHSDGHKSQQEAGVVVRPTDDAPRLRLDLTKERLESTEPLEGTLRSHFADARVLLTLRDSLGFRWAKTIRLRDGIAQFKEKLPKDIRYGACIEAIYTDAPTSIEPAYHASRYLQVIPRNRMVNIKTVHLDEVEPGSNVDVDIDVNRKEVVDLVVSVTDRALLDIHGGRPADIHNFYLADDRIRETHARDTLRRQLAGVTVLSLVKRADLIRKTLPKDSPDLAILDTLLKNYSAGRLTLDDVAALLRLAGLHARNVPVMDGKHMPENHRILNATLLQVLDQEIGGWKIHIASYYDTLLLAGMHARERPDPFTAPMVAPQRPFPYYPGYFPGGMIQGGIGMMGMGGGMQGYFSYAAPAVPKHEALALFQLPIIVPGGLDKGETWLRRDFSDIACWNANVRTDASGKAKVSFKLPDSLTSWEVRVTAVSRHMHVGSATSVIKAVRPIMVQPVLPRIFVEGDEVIVSAIVHNRSGAKQSVQVKLETRNGKVLSPAEEKLELTDKGQGTATWKFKAGEAGYAQLLLSASCTAGKDASLKRLPVIRAGAEQIVNWSGYAREHATVELPEGVKPDEAKLELTFAPSLAADLLDTLNYLVEYPYGCVEQTMSRFLPAVKVAQVLKKKKIDNDALARKLPNCVEGGIKRLLELQQPDGGWGWNGSSQTHEMMTPYALYGLIEAEKAGYEIPSKDAIRKGLDRLKKYIDGMGKDQTADRIYCMSVYAMKHDLDDASWRFISEQLEAKSFSDYAAALALETAVRHVQTRLADRLAKLLRDRAVLENGLASWKTAGFSRWADDRFEITAAAMKALVAYDKDDPLLPKVVDFFAKHKNGNRWNSTKDTAMIVYAMCDYLEKLREDTPESAKVVVRINDGDPIEVSPDARNESKVLSITAKSLRAGRNTIRFDKAPAGMLARASLRYMHSGKDLKPCANGIVVERSVFLHVSQGPPRRLQSGDTIPKGSFIRCTVEVRDPSNGGMRYLLVESSIPCGAEVLAEVDGRFPSLGGSAHVLREVREDKVAFHHEASPALVIDHCVLHMEMAGEFTLPPARAELMYDTKRHGHSGSFSLKVE